jgi:excisionase family DNA binding protein
MDGVKVGDLTLYDVKELAKSLDITERTLTRYLRDGRLQGRKLGRKWYVTGESLKAYFQQPEEMEMEEA